MVSLFYAEAMTLINAVQRGRILHRTRNIRESGGPLEMAFRDFLAMRIPTHFEVATGYLCDSDWNCTPQIDAMILKGQDAHILMAASDGSAYIPFPAAVAAVEIKTAARGVKDKLKQIEQIDSSVREMRARHRAKRLDEGAIEGAMLPELATMLLIADSERIDLVDMQDWFADRSKRAPGYVVLLDRGVIVAREAFMNSLLDYGNEQAELGYDDDRNPGEAHFWGAVGSGELAPGRILLWTYFYLVSRINRSDGNSRPMHEIAEWARQSHPARDLGKLAGATQIPDLTKI